MIHDYIDNAFYFHFSFMRIKNLRFIWNSLRRLSRNNRFFLVAVVENRKIPVHVFNNEIIFAVIFFLFRRKFNEWCKSWHNFIHRKLIYSLFWLKTSGQSFSCSAAPIWRPLHARVSNEFLELSIVSLPLVLRPKTMFAFNKDVFNLENNFPISF